MKKIIKILIVCLIVSLVVLLVVGVVVTMSTHSRVNALRQEIKASGDPFYLVDFEAEADEEENNAYFHLMNAREDINAFDEFLSNDLSGLSGINLSDTSNIAKSDLDALEKYVQEQTDLFAQIERMADCQKYQADIDFSKGISVLLPHVPLFGSVKNFLQAKTIVDVSQQKGDEAIRNCIEGLRISRLQMEEPLLVSFLVALQMEGAMLDSAFYVLSSTPTSVEVRADLKREVEASKRGRCAAQALKGERACGIQTFKDLREGDDEAFKGMGAPNLILDFAFKKTYLNDDESKFIEVMNIAIKLLDKPYAERVRFFDEVVTEVQNSDFRFAVTKLIQPAWFAVGEVVDIHNAKARCLQVILQLQAEGEVALDKLPEDPFSGKPLLALPSEQGWTVYSVGKNQQDDQGDIGTQGQLIRLTPDVGYGPFPVASSDEDAS